MGHTAGCISGVGEGEQQQKQAREVEEEEEGRRVRAEELFV